MKKSDLLKTLIFIIFILSFSILLFVLPSKDFSEWERRSLKQAPKLTSKDATSGKFMSDFDDYVLDQFPLRNSFRRLKAGFSKNILLKQDNNKFYYKDGYLSKIEYPFNQKKILNHTNSFNKIYKDFLESSQCKIYYSVIPDKNYFLNPDLLISFDSILSVVKNELSFAKYIPVNNLLDLQCFYKTDQHWRQEKIFSVASALLTGMDNTPVFDFEIESLNHPFYGTYWGQAALNVLPDQIAFCTNSILQESIVTSFNTGSAKEASLYDMKKAYGRDPYEMFLGGSDALLTIENPFGDKTRELIIFRDSFASSLTPLMVNCYSKITLVDLRYINPSLLKNFIEFKNQDVLFLYSTLILNGY